MREADWLTCSDPQKMLEHLVHTRGSGERRCRLFACACVRRIRHLLPDADFRRAVDVAECFADGAENVAHLALALENLDFSRCPRGATLSARNALLFAVANTEAASRVNPAFSLVDPTFGSNRVYDWGLACGTSSHARDAVVRKAARDARQSGKDARAAMRLAKRAEDEAQAWLLRDIATPFAAPPRLDPSVRAWDGGTVTKLAQAAYEDRALPSGHLDSTRLCVLADALEDAGASGTELVDHLRRRDPHVRGCWALDSVLGNA
jgi:hypothetical protein